MSKRNLVFVFLALLMVFSLATVTALADGKGNTEQPKPTKETKVKNSQWGEVDEAALDAYKAAVKTLTQKKVILKQKIHSYTVLKGTISDMLDAQKASQYAGLTEKQITALNAEVAKLKPASSSLRSARLDIVKAKKDYLNAKKDKDIASATDALTKQSALYDSACQKADEIYTILNNIKSILGS